MYRIMLLVGFCVAALSLSGCTTFGVSNAQWKTLSPAQRRVVMRNYYANQRAQARHQAEIDRINAENAPLTELVSTLGQMIPSHTSTHSSSHSTTTGHCSGDSCESSTTSSGSSTSVTTPF